MLDFTQVLFDWLNYHENTGLVVPIKDDPSLETLQTVKIYFTLLTLDTQVNLMISSTHLIEYMHNPYSSTNPPLKDDLFLDFSNTSGFAKLVHEQLVFQYLQGGTARDSALSASWFFLELTIKAMIEHLATTAR